MLRTMLFFRPILEFLEARRTPATLVAVDTAPAGSVAPVAQPVDGTTADSLFGSDFITYLPYVNDSRVSPIISASGQAAMMAVNDAVFSEQFTYVDHQSSSSYADTVFASSAFAFLPPPAPKTLPPTPYGACDVLQPALEPLAMTPRSEQPEDDADDYEPSEQPEHSEKLELVAA